MQAIVIPPIGFGMVYIYPNESIAAARCLPDRFVQFTCRHRCTTGVTFRLTPSHARNDDPTSVCAVVHLFGFICKV